MKGTMVMFQTHLHRCCALAAVLTTLACLLSAPAVQAEEPQYATVALLLPVGADLGNAIVFDDASSSGSGPLVIEGHSYFGVFSGTNLIPVSARYIGKGGISRQIVWGLDSELPPNHGVMPLRPATVEFRGFVWQDGMTLKPSSESSATALLVIVTGQVH